MKLKEINNMVEIISWTFLIVVTGNIILYTITRKRREKRW
jgi:hypothetical protein